MKPKDFDTQTVRLDIDSIELENSHDIIHRLQTLEAALNIRQTMQIVNTFYKDLEKLLMTIDKTLGARRYVDCDDVDNITILGGTLIHQIAETIMSLTDDIDKSTNAFNQAYLKTSD